MKLGKKKQQRKSKGARSTRKQRGGAAWAPANTAELGDRFALWEPYLKTEFPTLLTDRSVEPKDDAEKKARMDDFVRVMMKQDDLLQNALSILYQQKGLESGKLESLIANYETIQGVDANLDPILDVEKFLAFTFVKQEGTKWDSLRKEPLAELMFYPWRASNVMIRTLADILKSLKDDSSLLENEKFTGNAALQALQAAHFDATLRSNTYYLTDKGLRDGFYLTESNKDITAMFDTTKEKGGKFFTKLVSEIVAIQKQASEGGSEDTINFSLLNTDCKELFYNSPTMVSVYAKVTANLFHLYKKTDVWNTEVLLNQFYNTECKRESLERLKEGFLTYVPDEVYWDAQILSTQTTFRMLMNQIDPLLLNYVLHLSWALESETAGWPDAMKATPAASSNQSEETAAAAGQNPPAEEAGQNLTAAAATTGQNQSEETAAGQNLSEETAAGQNLTAAAAETAAGQTPPAEEAVAEAVAGQP